MYKELMVGGSSGHFTHHNSPTVEQPLLHWQAAIGHYLLLSNCHWRKRQVKGALGLDLPQQPHKQTGHYTLAPPLVTNVQSIMVQV